MLEEVGVKEEGEDVCVDVVEDLVFFVVGEGCVGLGVGLEEGGGFVGGGVCDGGRVDFVCCECCCCCWFMGWLRFIWGGYCW